MDTLEKLRTIIPEEYTLSDMDNADTFTIWQIYRLLYGHDPTPTTPT